MNIGFRNHIPPGSCQGFLENGILLGIGLDFHLTGAIDDMAGL